MRGAAVVDENRHARTELSRTDRSNDNQAGQSAMTCSCASLRLVVYLADRVTGD
jgi:hypothetical protein